MLNFRLFDDVEGRMYQEMVEVFEENTVELFQITIEIRLFDAPMSHEDRQRLLAGWWLTRDHRRHALRSDLYSPIDPAGSGHRQSYGKDPRLHR